MKEKAYAHGGQGQALGKGEAVHSGLSRQVALVAVWSLIGLIVPRASIYDGMAPFGVGVAAAVAGPGSAIVYLAAIVGYLLPMGTAYPLRYIASIVAVAGIKWSLKGLGGIRKSALFAPIIAFLATGCTGLAMKVVGGLDIYTVLLVVCESLIAGGFAYFSSTTVRVLDEGQAHGTLTAQEQASVVVTGAVVLMAVSTLEISGISPGRILAVMVILLLARCGREQGGCIAGVVLGLAMALSSPEHMHLAAAYSFGGLVAGIFSRFGRFASAGAFIVANTIVSMGVGTSEAGVGSIVILGVYEVAAASMIYVTLPPVLDRKINGFFAKAQDIAAVEGLRRSVVMRLDFASRAMAEVASTVDEVSRKLAGLSAPDMGTVYRSVSDDVCRVCGLRMYCWENRFSDTMASFNDLSPALREKGRASREDVNGHLLRHCSRLDEVLQRVNAGYTEYVVREGAWRRLSEIRSVVTDQFAGMADMLGELSEGFAASERVDAEAAARVTTVCEEHDLLVRDVVCFIGRGELMTVEILAADEGVRLKEDRWHRELCDACGREFDHPVVTRIGDAVKIALTEKPAYAVSVGSAQLCCTGEKLCGDAFETYYDGSGRMVVVLSDGMGSGGRAAVDGAMASGLTARLMQAGFGPDSVLRMVNSALMVKSGDESLATLDVAFIDLFSGRMDCLKAGAAVSLLRSMGRVSRIEHASLPIGILRDIAFEHSKDTLVDGDLLLMMSDGAMSGGVGWIEERLRDYDGKEMPIRQFAESIAEEARRRQQGEREDDITVVALRMSRVKRRDERHNR